MKINQSIVIPVVLKDFGEDKKRIVKTVTNQLEITMLREHTNA